MSYLGLLWTKLNVPSVGMPSVVWAIVLILLMRQPEAWVVLGNVVSRIKELRFCWFSMTFFDPMTPEDSPEVEGPPVPKRKRRSRSKVEFPKADGSGDSQATPTGGQS